MRQPINPAVALCGPATCVPAHIVNIQALASRKLCCQVPANCAAVPAACAGQPVNPGSVLDVIMRFCHDGCMSLLATLMMTGAAATAVCLRSRPWQLLHTEGMQTSHNRRMRHNTEQRITGHLEFDQSRLVSPLFYG